LRATSLRRCCKRSSVTRIARVASRLTTSRCILLHLVATSFRVRFGSPLGLAVACGFLLVPACLAVRGQRLLPQLLGVGRFLGGQRSGRRSASPRQQPEQRAPAFHTKRIDRGNRASIVATSLGGVLMLASCVAARTVGGRFVGPRGVRPDEHLCVADPYGTTARSLPASIVWSFLAKDKLCVEAHQHERSRRQRLALLAGAVRSRCALCDASFSVLICSVLHHSAHVAHAARHARSDLLGRLGDDRFGHENVLRDRGGVL